MLLKKLNPVIAFSEKGIILQTNINEFFLFKSIRGFEDQFWPVLGEILHQHKSNVFSIRIFFGNQNPKILIFLLSSLLN